MYESPMRLVIDDLVTEINNQLGSLMVQATQNVGIDVDKNELIKALKYDRQQYEKGYRDAKAERDWIPVSERLPEEGGYVLCSQINGDVGEGKRLKHGWLIMYESQEYGDYFVEAWQPLPERYREEGD